jgi:hypothetical protein
MILVAGGVAAVVDDGAGGAGFLLGGYLHVHTDQRRVFDEASRGWRVRYQRLIHHQ